MKKLRIFLIPFMAIIELVVLAAAWVLVWCGFTDKAKQLVNFVTARLPNREWYFGE